jgi:hypothetical protein
MDSLKETLISMGIDASTIPDPQNQKPVRGITLKDADTVTTPDNTDIRLQGISAAETAKFMPGVKIKGSEYGANTQTDLVRQTIEEGNYTQPTYTGAATYDRKVGDLINPQGQSLTSDLISKGYVDLDKSATRNQMDTQAFGALNRRQRELEGKRTKGDELLEQLVGEQNPRGSFQAKMYTPTAKSFNQADLDYFVGPAIVRPGEDYKGEALNNWSTGLDIGTTQMKQGLWGSLEMLGEKTGIDWLKDNATANVRMHQSNLENLPFLRSGEAFDEKTGEFKLDSLSKIIDFGIGQAASSAPQMLTTIVASLAAPITGGLSMSVPAAIYIGQTWNGQNDDNKSATAALAAGITMTALDKLGLKGFSPKGLDITKPATQALVKRELMKKHSADVAEQMIINATKGSVREVAQVLRAETIKQATGLKQVGKSTVVGAGTEGVTESLQELVGYLGENVTLNPIPSTVEEQNKLKNRLANAAFGGALLGGGLSGAGTAISTATTSRDLLEQSSDGEFRRKWMDQTGSSRMFDVDQIIKQIPVGEEVTLSKLAEGEETKRMVQGRISSWAQDKGVRSLFGKWSSTIMRGMSHQDEAMATLSTLIGASKAANGMSIDDKQKLAEANMFSLFGTQEQMEAAFGGITTQQASAVLTDPSVTKEIGRILQERKSRADNTSSAEVGKSIFADFGKYNEYSNGILEYADKVQALVDKYNNTIGAETPSSRLTVKQFLEDRPLDKTQVSRNSGSFVKDLMSVYGMTKPEAEATLNSILNNQAVQTVEDTTENLLDPDAGSRFKNRSEVLSMMNDPANRAKFNKYLSTDLLDSAFSLAARGAAMAVNKDYIGKDGSKLAGLIQQSLSQGNIDAEVASFMAKELKDWMDMRAGKYRPITNPYIRGALNTVNFLATITSLPLAAISSTVEFAQVYRNLNKPQSIKATKLLLTSFGKEFTTLFKDLGQGVTGKGTKQASEMRTELSKAGFPRDGGIGSRNDIMSGFFQKYTEGFFKITGLTSVTAVTRHAKLGIAADALNNWLSKVKGDQLLETQEARDAYDHLVRLGVDVEWMIQDNMKDTVDNKNKFNSIVQMASYNFINEAVVIPTQLNRPKFYSDPYLRLVTQFQGYISTFTANIIPRLIGDLGKAGSEDQKNAAATIAMMFAMSMLALYIKDLIKYGESPPEWLKDEKEFQRLVGQMGILGTGQRIWDTIDPMFEERKSNSMLANAWKAVSDQSPQLAYINKVDSFLSEIPKDNGKEIQRGARILPILGTSPAFAKYLQTELGE